jgi:UDPglucose 6-dehydrogenase
MSEKPTIGFIGQGYVGASYARNYEARGYPVVRYEKGVSYRQSKAALASCSIVFVAVPTPSTPQGFNAGVVREVMKLIHPGTIVVIKSTLLPGTTESIQAENPGLVVLFSPEFLSVATAQADTDAPPRTIMGIPKDTPAYRQAAQTVLATLPPAEYTRITSARTAEIIKYGKNTLGVVRILHTNILYDLSCAHGAVWADVKEAMQHDPDQLTHYLEPLHKSGRGAGGECFIKDYEAFIKDYEAHVADEPGLSWLKAGRRKNLSLLRQSGKDKRIVDGVYGPHIFSP